MDASTKSILKRIEEKVKNLFKPARKINTAIQNGFKKTWKRGGNKCYLYALANTKIPCNLTYVPDRAEFLRTNYSELSRLISGLCHFRHMSDMDTEDIQGEFFRRYLKNKVGYDPARGEVGGIRLFVLIMLSCILIKHRQQSLKDAGLMVHNASADVAVENEYSEIMLASNRAFHRVCRERKIDHRIAETYKMKSEGLRNVEIAKHLKLSSVSVGHFVHVYENIFHDIYSKGNISSIRKPIAWQGATAGTMPSTRRNS